MCALDGWILFLSAHTAARRIRSTQLVQQDDDEQIQNDELSSHVPCKFQSSYECLIHDQISEGFSHGHEFEMWGHAN